MNTCIFSRFTHIVSVHDGRMQPTLDKNERWRGWSWLLGGLRLFVRSDHGICFCFVFFELILIRGRVALPC